MSKEQIIEAMAEAIELRTALCFGVAVPSELAKAAYEAAGIDGIIRTYIPAEASKFAYAAGVAGSVEAGSHLLAVRAERDKLQALVRELGEVLQQCDDAMGYMSEYDIPLCLPDDVKQALAKIPAEYRS